VTDPWRTECPASRRPDTRQVTPPSRAGHAAGDTHRRTRHTPVTFATAAPHLRSSRRFGV